LLRVERLTLRRLAVALPLVFVVHVVEEWPGFVAWFDQQVRPPITQELFASVNVVGLLVTIVVAAVLVSASNAAVGLLAVGWIGCVMLANGLFHLVATAVLGRYCPGVVTAGLLYLPTAGLLFWRVVRELGVPPWAVAGVALLAGLPMYLHGYLIVFRGSRLF
jgi:hypothetical protein